MFHDPDREKDITNLTDLSNEVIGTLALGSERLVTIDLHNEQIFFGDSAFGSSCDPEVIKKFLVSCGALEDEGKDVLKDVGGEGQCHLKISFPEQAEDLDSHQLVTDRFRWLKTVKEGMSIYNIEPLRDPIVSLQYVGDSSKLKELILNSIVLKGSQRVLLVPAQGLMSIGGKKYNAPRYLLNEFLAESKALGPIPEGRRFARGVTDVRWLDSRLLDSNDKKSDCFHWKRYTWSKSETGSTYDIWHLQASITTGDRARLKPIESQSLGHMYPAIDERMNLQSAFALNPHESTVFDTQRLPAELELKIKQWLIDQDYFESSEEDLQQSHDDGENFYFNFLFLDGDDSYVIREEKHGLIEDLCKAFNLNRNQIHIRQVPELGLNSFYLRINYESSSDS